MNLIALYLWAVIGNVCCIAAQRAFICNVLSHEWVREKVDHFICPQQADEDDKQGLCSSKAADCEWRHHSLFSFSSKKQTIGYVIDANQYTFESIQSTSTPIYALLPFISKDTGHMSVIAINLLYVVCMTRILQSYLLHIKKMHKWIVCPSLTEHMKAHATTEGS